MAQTGDSERAGTLQGLADDLARQFARAGPPGAGSAAAVTGAIAAGLLEWAAARSEQRGPAGFRQRAGSVRARATALQASLASAAQQDAERVRTLLGAASKARERATDSLLEIAARCAQLAALAAEVAQHGHPALRADVEAAQRLACCATECALELAQENLRGEAADETWVLDASQRIHQAQLALPRAAPLLGQEPSA